MKVKLFFTIVILSAMIICGCDREKPKPTKPTTGEKLKVAFVYVAPVGDAGWSWAHDQGRKEMEKLPFIESTSIVESVPEGSEANRVINRFAAKGYRLIFTTSYGYMDPTIEEAKKYPDCVFMHCSGFKTSKNVGTYFGRIYQARYLTGLLAGKMTKSNIIGYVAAHPIPEVKRGINAFTLGVRAANPKAEVRVVWTGTWYDPAKERDAAESLLDMNADIIAQHQDSPAAQQAAEGRGKYSIGYNADMERFAPKAHLTAAIWHWGVLYKKIAEQVHDKTWKSEQIWWGLKEGLVDISPMNKKLVPPKYEKLVRGERQKIIDGKLKIFQGPIKDNQGTIIVKDGTCATDAELLKMDYFVEGVKVSK